MVGILREPVFDPAAWRSDEIGGKSGLARALHEQELAAFDALLDRIRETPVLELRREHFADPCLDALARACGAELAHGRGAVILTGLDPARYGEAGFQRIYWYLGQGLGRPSPQSERGDLLGYVRQEKDNPFGRGYISNMELSFHNDFHEVLSLACVQVSERGGESRLVSSLTVHNMLLAERPDLLETLYDGWYDGMEAFYRIFRPKAELSPHYIPLFCSAAGFLSFHGCRSMFYDRAADERGEVIPAHLQEALAAVQHIATRPGVAAQFTLGRGEMMFWHNWTLLHARSRFENAPGRERLLMRLWLNPHEERPTPLAIKSRARDVDRIHQELGARAVV